MAGQQQAARWMEVDVVGGGQAVVARLAGEPAWCDAVRASEGAGECFDGVITRLQRSGGDGGAAPQLPRGAFQQQAPPECRRRLADAGAHEPVEVKRTEHRPRRERAPIKAVVECLDHGIDDIPQAIRVRRHAPEYCPSARPGA